MVGMDEGVVQPVRREATADGDADDGGGGDERSEAELPGDLEHHHSEEEPDAPTPCHQRRRSDESVQPGLGGARVAIESVVLQYHE